MDFLKAYVLIRFLFFLAWGLQYNKENSIKRGSKDMIGLTLITGIIAFLFGIGLNNWGFLTVAFILLAFSITINITKGMDEQGEKERLEFNERQGKEK
jgi:hypothetical protein